MTSESLPCENRVARQSLPACLKLLCRTYSNFDSDVVILPCFCQINGSSRRHALELPDTGLEFGFNLCTEKNDHSKCSAVEDVRAVS